MHRHAYAVLAAVLLSGAASLGGCAATADSAAPQAAAEPINPAPRIAVPPASIGVWYDLGAYQAPWLAGDGPVPMAGPAVPTRVVGWKRQADAQDPGKAKTDPDEWLAIVIVQAAPGAYAPCPAQATSLDVADAGAGCLRLRRNADFDHWMQAAQPALYRWVDDHGWTSLPRAWAAYRLPSAGGGALEVLALFAPSLIEPATRNTTDFITSGLPGQQWARQLAAAVRGLDGAASRVFAVPPFPFAPGPRAEQEAGLPDMLPAPPRARASAPKAAPAVAEQVIPATAPKPQPHHSAAPR